MACFWIVVIALALVALGVMVGSFFRMRDNDYH